MARAFVYSSAEPFDTIQMTLAARTLIGLLAGSVALNFGDRAQHRENLISRSRSGVCVERNW